MNIITKIFEEMSTDDACSEDQSERIKKEYGQATKKERELIDEILISLCGWSIPSILESIEEDEISEPPAREFISFSAKINDDHLVRLTCDIKDIDIITRDNEKSFDVKENGKKLESIYFEDIYHE